MKIFLIVLLASLIFIPTSSAKTLHKGWKDDIQIIAAEFWEGRTANICNNVQFVVADLQDSALGHADIGDCRTDQAGTIYVDDQSPLRGWRLFCVVSLHEWGHLLGKVHRNGPVIMNPRPNAFGWERWCRPTLRP